MRAGAFYMTTTPPVTIGTPLSPTATRVMLLGSGERGKEVLIALQRLGVETIAVDRYDHAPGQQVAHHARTITMSDPAALRALVEAEKPALVVPEIEAIATPELQKLEAEGVVAKVRDMLGPTNSKEAPEGTIRGDFGEDMMVNVCHASDSPENGEIEVKRFFGADEVFAA